MGFGGQGDPWPSRQGPNREPYFLAMLLFVIKALVWGLGPNGWLDPTQGTQLSPTSYDTPHSKKVGLKSRKIGKASLAYHGLGVRAGS